ncbi:MAG: heme-binding beta-barrel domain-containing protein [Mariprofundaceae bacterium]
MEASRDALGPLAPLAGIWEGDAGVDLAPSPDGPVETRYRERLELAPMGEVANGPQRLQALRYRTTAWPLGEDEPFHEELGYWLWDACRGEVMRCFMVPRGVNVLAGGKAQPGDRTLHLAAEVGSAVFGISSNPFLDEHFRTIRYALEIEILDDSRFRYAEDTQLQIPDAGLFHHTDRNTLNRVG